MKRLLAGAALAAAALAALALPHTPALPSCGYEDGSGGPVPCFWDASEHGNGTGHDVIVLTAP